MNMNQYYLVHLPFVQKVLSYNLTNDYFFMMFSLFQFNLMLILKNKMSRKGITDDITDDIKNVNLMTSRKTLLKHFPNHFFITI